MKINGLICLIVLMNSIMNAQNIFTHLPENIKPAEKYIFYLHGRIIEEQGIHAVSEQFGPYQYEEILKSLAADGFNVISEARKKNTDPFRCAEKVVAQIDSLLKSGAPAKNISVVGASKGAGIAVLISNLLKNRELNFVIMAICSPDMAKMWKENNVQLWGRVLYIFDTSDELAGGCNGYMETLKSEGLTVYKEIELKLGLGHGFLYAPMKEWITPALEFILSGDNQ